MRVRLWQASPGEAANGDRGLSEAAAKVKSVTFHCDRNPVSGMKTANCSHSWHFLEVYKASDDGVLKFGKARCRHCDVVSVTLSEMPASAAGDFGKMEWSQLDLKQKLVIVGYIVVLTFVIAFYDRHGRRWP